MDETNYERNILHTVGVNFTDNRLVYSVPDSFKIPEILGNMYGKKTKMLDLSFNSLITLQGLESFQNLEELILDNNQLSDTVQFPHLPFLHTLSLNKNNLINLETLILKISERIHNLSYLSLLGNRACPDQLSDIEKDQNDYQRYRYFVLYHIPTLKFLDSTRVTDTEKQEARRRGQFTKVVRPNDFETRLDNSIVISQFTPLPDSQRGYDDHKGAYGKCRYRYSGKHSEGNRFIFNNDL